MKLRRRDWIAASLAAPLAAAPKTSMMVAATSYMGVRRFKDTLEFLEHCHTLGAAGIQAQISNHDPSYLKTLRSKAESYGMAIEIMAALPRSDNDEAFARTVQTAKTLGARCIRSACLGGRRYETFSSREDWALFVKNSRTAVTRALALVEKTKVSLALENHKDWTVDEMLSLIKAYSSEYLGICLDTGNNISLLDEPMDVVQRLSPFTIATHIKDMGVDEYHDGFLLSEVPFGDGYLDLAAIIDTIRKKARPGTRFTLEMITRDPLKVPCLTEKYWETFGEGNGRKLAATLRAVRTAKCKKPLPMPSSLSLQAQLEQEEANVRHCLEFARTKLNI
ncbi:MAG: sugar phosphate isomerase/epimerase [Bryobacteraceae bacterium]|nr:sugar phosphate isomerase/epimerase [Bryobacteraceae bacterium]MDW8380066.1 TIM barrel protein [Bryobacterales bacterium]